MDSRIERLGIEKQQEEAQHKALALIWSHMFNFIHTMSLKCAIELAIPDAIHNHGSPMTLTDLAAKLPINPSKISQLNRLMRILSHSGFFALQKSGHDQQGYALTHASRLLLKDDPLSVAPLFLSFLDPPMTRPWDHLTTWFQNDDPTAFVTTHGLRFWEYLPRQPEMSRFFNDALARDTRLVLGNVIDKHKEVFEGVKTLVDVGGNTGTMARGIADAFPNMECIVFDRPSMVSGLEGTKNLKFVGGDMFESIPPADAILLKWIVTDWIDEECVRILEQCKKAISSNEGEGGKVIIIEMGMDSEDEDYLETQLLFDMELLTLVNGKERNEPEWANLFTSAGFSRYKITPILGIRSLIEVYP